MLLQHLWNQSGTWLCSCELCENDPGFSPCKLHDWIFSLLITRHPPPASDAIWLRQFDSDKLAMNTCEHGKCPCICSHDLLKISQRQVLEELVLSFSTTTRIPHKVGLLRKLCGNAVGFGNYGIEESLVLSSVIWCSISKFGEMNLQSRILTLWCAFSRCGWSNYGPGMGHT